MKLAKLWMLLLACLLLGVVPGCGADSDGGDASDGTENSEFCEFAVECCPGLTIDSCEASLGSGAQADADAAGCSAEYSAASACNEALTCEEFGTKCTSTGEGTPCFEEDSALSTCLDGAGGA